MKILVLDDGNRGNLNQSLGIAERLPGLEVEIIEVPPLSFLKRAVLILVANLSNLTPLFKIRFLLRRFVNITPVFHPDRPAAVISAGARLAPVNILLSRCNSAKTFQVLYPGFIRLRLFDLVVLPEHDRWRYPKVAGAKNLMVIKGAPNRITPSGLMNQAPTNLERRGSIYRTRIAVLIGGDDKNYRISEEWTKELCQRLTEISEKLPAKIYLTTSRRTGSEVENIFRKLLGDKPERFRLVLYGDNFANPVGEFLAAANLIITTEDSINMVSEAASSGKPTAVLKVERKHQRHLVFDRALEELAAENYIRLWSINDLTSSKVSEAIVSPDRKILAETEKVAAKVLEILKIIIL